METRYSIQWEQIQTLDDLKRLLEAAGFELKGDCDLSGIPDEWLRPYAWHEPLQAPLPPLKPFRL